LYTGFRSDIPASAQTRIRIPGTVNKNEMPDRLFSSAWHPILLAIQNQAVFRWLKNV